MSKNPFAAWSSKNTKEYIKDKKIIKLFDSRNAH